MNSIDLSCFEIDQKIDLEGEVVESSVVVDGTLLFFFEENHACDAAVRSCLKMACKVIDAGIVNTVCVEGYPCGAYQNKGLRNLGKHALRQHIADDVFIANPIRNTKNYILFGDTLCILRPAVNIVGIEDTEAYNNAGNALSSQPEKICDRAVEAVKDIIEGLSSIKSIDDHVVRQKPFMKPLDKLFKSIDLSCQVTVGVIFIGPYRLFL